MDSIKWKCKYWTTYFKKFDNFHFINLIVKKLDVFNFHPIFFAIALTNCYCYHTHVRYLNTIFKNIHQKWEYYREEKQGFERL